MQFLDLHIYVETLQYKSLHVLGSPPESVAHVLHWAPDPGETLGGPLFHVGIG